MNTIRNSYATGSTTDRLVWKKRQQWAAIDRRHNFGIDVVIDKSAAGFTWWVDVLDRGIGQTHAEYSAQPPARSLVEAKRRAAEQVDTFIARLVHSRGGA